MKTVVNLFVYLILMAIPVGIYFLCRHLSLPQISGSFAVLSGLSCAFVWVYILHWGWKKPFNCMKCMSGWVTLFIAWAFHVPLFPFYLFIGLFAGALFDAIKIRWL